MHTFHLVLCDVLKDYGYNDIATVFPYEKFKLAWYSFLKLLDIDMSTGFICSTCRDEPDIVVCDGTSLAFQRRMWTWQHSDEASTPVIDVQARYESHYSLLN